MTKKELTMEECLEEVKSLKKVVLEKCKELEMEVDLENEDDIPFCRLDFYYKKLKAMNELLDRFKEERESR